MAGAGAKCLLLAGLVILASASQASSTSQVITRTLIEKDATWAYLDDNMPPGDGWHEQDYEDSSWKRGRSYFSTPESIGVEGVRTPLDKSEKTYPTYYFRGEFFLEDVNDIKELRYWIDYDDAYIVYLNGRPVASSSPSCRWDDHWSYCGEPIHNSQVDVKAKGRDLPFSGSLGEAALSLLRSGRNVVAVAVKQSLETSSDGAFAMGLYAQEVEEAPSEAARQLQTAALAAALVIAGALAAVKYRGIRASSRGCESAIRGEIDLLNGEMAKSREMFHRREIDEDTMREMTGEYQKRIISLEVKLDRLKGKGGGGPK